MVQKNKQKIVIIGAGPAGLACAYELVQSQSLKDIDIVILERNNNVGGLSRTIKYKDYLFDIGPHRFFTKNKEVLNLWKKILGPDLIEVNRLTRMLYKNKFFLYPVKIKDVIQKLGLKDNFESGLSFLYAKLFFRKLNPVTFEDWITKNFGKKLFNTFFKTYTEKVWGIPCSQIGAEWADQRIRNLNFIETLKTAIFGEKARKAKTLVSKFYYPSFGAGYFYQKMADIISEKGVKMILNSQVTAIHHQNNNLEEIEYLQNSKKYKLMANYVFSSMPITNLVFCLYPAPSPKISHSAKKLFFRDHITVNLITQKNNLFPDNWIYIHSPEIKMARVTSFGNFSKKMIKNKNYSTLSVEYFVFQKDKIWSMSDEEIINLAKQELERVHLVEAKEVIDGFVDRETESYPTYYIGYSKYFNNLKNYLKQFKNLQLIGRAGMYKYNNMDHSIYSGILAARNYLLGQEKYDLWKINEDAEYLEEIERV